MGLKSFFHTITTGWEDWRVLLAARDDDDDDYNFASGARRGMEYNFPSGPRRGTERYESEEEGYDSRSETLRTPSSSS